MVSNEPVFQIAPPQISNVLTTLTAEAWKTNENSCQQVLSFYAAVIYNVIETANRCTLTLPESFWSLVRELATISKSMCVLFCVCVFFSQKKNTKDTNI